MFHEELNLKILRMLHSHWDRVVSLDIETYVKDQKFLVGERILAIGLARRKDGEFMEEKGIEVTTLFLEEDSNASEIELFKKLGRVLAKIRPLCIVGYGIRFYDIPLIILKKQCYGNQMKTYNEYWKLVDFAESTIPIDLYHILKYKRYRKLNDVITSDEFSKLPLKKAKGVVKGSGQEKANEIYRLWNEEIELLRTYVEGDVHDVLLIAEKLAFG